MNTLQSANLTIDIDQKNGVIKFSLDMAGSQVTRKVSFTDTDNAFRAAIFYRLVNETPVFSSDRSEDALEAGKEVFKEIGSNLVVACPSAVEVAKGLMTPPESGEELRLKLNPYTLYTDYEDALLIIAMFFLSTGTRAALGAEMVDAVFAKWMNEDATPTMMMMLAPGREEVN